jgi:hypothetical protein
MKHVLKLQTLKSEPVSIDLGDLLMSSASGICPTRSAAPQFEME